MVKKKNKRGGWLMLHPICAKDLTGLIRELGFLPLFDNGIPGFSVRDFVPAEYWFQEGVPGPWDWREEIAAAGEIAYGKFFGKKAGFISREWLPDFANYRRDGYDFDALWEDGLASYREKQVMDVLAAGGSQLSYQLRERAGFGAEGLKGFDGVLTKLQMRMYLTVQRFEYKRDRHGAEYGWGVARYTTPEALFGEDLIRSAYMRDPTESWARICSRAREIVPAADRAALERLLR